ncbi:hypothetical protein CGRA01v4_01344 [Colletotrichum graminicola]|nr:hypothetical protein CGRA01v4_01344 [Colletotrichum graminicola]
MPFLPNNQPTERLLLLPLSSNVHNLSLASTAMNQRALMY